LRRGGELRANMTSGSKALELERLVTEADHLRAKLSIARNAHTSRGETLDRLERTIAMLDREIAETSRVIGAKPSKRR
jgi:hypothetical protein